MSTNKFYTFILAFFLLNNAKAQTTFTEYICNKTGPSNAHEMFEYNGKTYFSAWDSIYGKELWVTDGTQAGTKILKDIEQGSMGSDPHSFIVMNGKLYFNAHTDFYGNELWETDGTELGTVLVKDICLGAGQGGNPSGITFLNGKLFFAAFDYANGIELWSSDGTAAGTVLVKDINPLFSHGIGSSSYPENLAVFNGNLYFTAFDSIHGKEIWVSDGTTSGTHLLKDINPGINSIDASEFTVMNNKLYFSMIPNITCGELWGTDGTANGTQVVASLYCYPAQKPRNLIANGGKLFFISESNQYGQEPWVSDGTSAGTQILKDIQPGILASNPSNFIVFDNHLYFIASDAVGASIWKTDGTSSNTVQVTQLNINNAQLIPESIIAYNQNLYFVASLPNVTDFQVFKWNSATLTAQSIAPINATHTNPLDPTSLTFLKFALSQSSLYFSAEYDNNMNQLWRIQENNVGIQEKVLSSFCIYPNPASKEIFIEGLETNSPVVVSDLVGKIILQTQSTNTVLNINVSDFPQGIYLVTIQQADKSSTKKLVIE